MYGDAVGTQVSGRIRQCGRSSGVAVKRGSTVSLLLAEICTIKGNFCYFYEYIFNKEEKIKNHNQ